MILEKRGYLVTLASVFVLATGCGDDGGPVTPVDSIPPSAPRGLTTITGDENVTLIWRSNTEADLEAYNVYWSFNGSDFNLTATTADTNFVDFDVRNGETVYYAVSAFDLSGNESALSIATFDTPRPAGYDVQLSDANTSPATAGFSFEGALSGQGGISADSQSADFYFYIGEPESTPYIKGGNRTGTRTTLIMMWGPTASFADMTYAPDPSDPGSNYEQNGAFPAYTGYTYVLQTEDGNFAQVRITNLISDYMIFDWAYQTDPYNPELVPSVPLTRP